MKRFATLPALIFLLFLGAQAQITPDTLHPVREVIFGIELYDPYRGFENMDDPAVMDWMSQKNEQARQILASRPGYDGLQSLIKTLTTSSDIRARVPVVNQEYIYVLQNISSNNTAQIVRYQDPLGPGEVIFSTAKFNEQDSLTFGVYSFDPSPDNRYLALQMDQDGNDWMEIYLYDIQRQQIIERINATMSFFPSWIDEGSLFYTQINLTDDPNEFFSNIKVKYHQLGTDQAQDKIMLAQDINPVIDYQAGDFPSFSVLPGGQYVQCAIARGVSPYPRSYLAPLAKVLETEKTKTWQLVYDFEDQVAQDAADAQYLYLLSDKTKALTKVPLDQPEQQTLLLEAPAQGYLQDLLVTSQGVFAEVVQGGLSSLLDVERHQLIPTPFRGSIDLHAAGASATSNGEPLLFGLSNWIHGFGIYYYDPVAGQTVRTDMRPAGPHDLPENLMVEEVEVKAQDGAMVPLSIIYDGSMARNGSNPTIVEAYGAYGESLESYFSVEMLPWYEQGGILAVAHVRGGGEKGVAWHQAGKMANKSNSWQDLVSVAHYLIEQKYTRSEKLGLMAGSAGGVAAGRAITVAPELFAAAVLEYALLNTTRLDQQAGGYVQYEEFGSPQDSVQFGYLYNMDVYHHIEAGQNYPAILFTAGKNDQRTLTWEPAKVAARFETYRGNECPTLFRLYQGGHGTGTAEEEIEMLSDKLTFFRWQLGMIDLGPSSFTGQ